MSDKQTSFLDEFDEVQLKAVEVPKTNGTSPYETDEVYAQPKQEHKSLEEEIPPEKEGNVSTLEDISFSASTTVKPVEVPYSAKSENRQQYDYSKDTAVIDKSSLSTFDRICVNVSDEMDKADEIMQKVFKHARRFGNRAVSIFNSNKSLLIFQKGQLVVCGDFKFLQRNNELMLLQYTGSSDNVIVPDSVGGLPVTFISDKAFRKGRFSTTTRLKNVWDSLKTDEIKVYSFENIVYAYKGILSIQLPLNLRYLPNGIFKHCSNMKSIEVPENVEYIAPNAFRSSGLEQIILSCKRTKGMSYVYTPKNALIFVKSMYKDEYSGIKEGYYEE